MVLDFRNLTRGEWIAGIAGAALLVVMVAFKWYGVRAGGLLDENLAPYTFEGDTRNVFQSFAVIDLVLLAVALAAIALPLFSAARSRLPLPLRPGAVIGALGLLALALIAFRVISPPDLATGVNGEQLRVSDFPNADVVRKIGVWLGLLAAGVLAIGALIGVWERSRSPAAEAPWEYSG